MVAITYNHQSLLNEVTDMAQKIDLLIRHGSHQIRWFVPSLLTIFRCRGLLRKVARIENLESDGDVEFLKSLKTGLEGLEKEIMEWAEIEKKLNSPHFLIQMLTNLAEDFENKIENLSFAVDGEIRELAMAVQDKFGRK